jgi:hypothetical protein
MDARGVNWAKTCAAGSLAVFAILIDAANEEAVALAATR